MKIKLDENLPSALRELLAELGHYVDSVVSEGLAGGSTRTGLAVGGTRSCASATSHLARGPAGAGPSELQTTAPGNGAQALACEA